MASIIQVKVSSIIIICAAAAFYCCSADIKRVNCYKLNN